MNLSINYGGASAIFKTIIFILLSAAHFEAATFTVTNTNDSGAGSFRQAILNADATLAADTIEFNIPGGGVHTITPAFSLPTISRTVTIDGTTQPGYAGVPVIEINASNALHGLSLEQPNNAGSVNFVVKGLIINRALSDGIHLFSFEYSGSGITITGCYIGTNSSGTADLGNGADGINVTAETVTIGGTGFGQRNVISGNGRHGINYANPPLAIGQGMEIYNNYIGTNAAGTGDLGNAVDGIHIYSGTHIIGGTSMAHRHVFGRTFEIVSTRTPGALPTC